MSLSDLEIRKAKPAAKPYKLFDGEGLYVEVRPTGSKLWRLKYYFEGTEKTISFGKYPFLSIANARNRMRAARELLANGIDPSERRKRDKSERQDKAANSFEVVAREWFTKWKPTWAASHANKVLKLLENDVFPWMGKRPISECSEDVPELLKVFERIDGRGAQDSAHRALQNCSRIFRYAVATGKAKRDPTPDLRRVLPPAKHKHFASITEPKQVGALLRAIDAFEGTFVVQCALRLAPMLFVRPGELRKAMWKDFDLQKGEWSYLSTKKNKQHIVPLSSQALHILRDLHKKTGARAYVFPGRDPAKPMSEAAVNAALRRMGYDTRTEITGHGFRAMARTILHEELDFKPEVIEHQLAHRVPDALGNAYNRTKFIKQRREMAQRWCDYLDELKAGAKVVALHTVAA